MKYFLLCVTLVSVLTGCAVIRQPPEAEPGVADAAAWQAHRETLAALKTWALQGRVATGQLLGWTGNLNWRQNGEDFDVRLSGPMGAGGFRASGTLDRVVIRTGDRRMVTTEPDALVAQTLGWTFPLEPLRYWGRGLPAPGGYDRISVDAQGRLVAIEQDGWKVAFPEYAEPDGAPALPERIVLDNGETRIRLVVDRWFDIGGADAPNA